MADSKFCAGCQRDGKDITAVAWCSDCSDLVCMACSRVHKKMSPPHKVVLMKEIQQPSSSLLNLSKNCKNHPDQKIILYCCQHDKVICDSCVPISHQNCKSVISIEKAAKGVKDGTALSDLERRLSNLCQVTENRQSQSESTLVDLEKSHTIIKKRVSEIKQKVISHLDRLEAEIHKDIDYKYKTCTQMVSRNRNITRSSTDSLSTWKSDLHSLKQHTSEIHLFLLVKFLDAITYQKELEIRELQAATVPILKYHPPESESNIKKLVPDLGTITVENIQIQMPLLDIDQQAQLLVRDEKMLSLIHSFPTTKFGNKVTINNGCFIPDDRLLLYHFKKEQLIVCKHDGSNSSVINLDYGLSSICLYDKNHAVISLDSLGIQILDLTSLKTGGIIEVDGYCTGITSVKDKIWVNSSIQTITIVDINGKNLKKLQTTFKPRNICANQDDDVYCTDYGNNKVYVVSSDGKEREVYKSPELKRPAGVAVDDRGDVYVAGFMSNNIHKISNDGQKHEIVLSANDGLYMPCGISYNNETKELLVLNNGYKFINIYKIKTLA